MSASCEFFAPNGSKSKVAQYLEQKYGEKSTLKLWADLNSEFFLSNVIDWRSATEAIKPLLTEDNELIPVVAEYALYVSERMKAFDRLPGEGRVRMIETDYRDNAETAATVYNSSVVQSSNNGRTVFRVAANRPIFDVEKAKELASGKLVDYSLQDNSATPVDVFTRASVSTDTNYIYLFTDNAGRTSGSNPMLQATWYTEKYGMKNFPTQTQAVIRGLPNAFPITTMVDDKRTQWTDDRFDEYKAIIDSEILDIKNAMADFKGIKYAGKAEFGKGQISNMKETAPKIWAYMNTKLAEIGIINDKSAAVPATPAEPGAEKAAALAAILAEYTFPAQDTRAPRVVNDEAIVRGLNKMFAEKYNATGEFIGYFDQGNQQKEAVDALLSSVYTGLRNSLANGDTLTVGTLVDALKNTRAAIEALERRLPAGPQRDSLSEVLRSYDQLAGFALQRLRGYNFSISDKIINKIGDYLKSSAVINQEIPETQDQATGFTDEETGTDISGQEQRGLRDWSDIAFELNPMDTASKRLKFFMATIKESEIGIEDTPRTLSLVIGDPTLQDRILSGEKRFTVRTPSQAENIRFGPDGRGVINIKGQIYEVKEVTRLNSTEELRAYQSVFNEEKVDAMPGSVVYSIDKFVPRNNVPKNKLSYLGLPILADYENLFTEVMGILSDTEPSWDKFYSILSNSDKPNFKRLAQELQNSDEQLRNEFVKVMSKQYAPFTIVLFNQRTMPDGRTIMEARPINANRSSAIQVIVNQWKENQKEAAIIEKMDNGMLKVNSAMAARWQTILDRLNTIGVYDLNESNKANLIPFAKEILEANGIVLGEEAFADLRTNTTRYTKNTAFAGDWVKQFQVSKDGKPMGIFSTIIMKLSGKSIDDGDSSELEISEDSFLKNNNPIYTEKSAINVLANAAARFAPRLYSATHRSSEGKTIYDYSLNSYESHEIRKLKTDDNHLSLLSTVTFAKRSWMLKNLQNSPELRSKLQLAYLDGLKARYRRSADGVTRPEMSNREQSLTVLSMLQNSGYKYGHFIDMTKSDKTTTPVLMNVQKLVLTSTLTNQKVVQDALDDVFMSEFERIREWSDPNYKAKFNNAQYQKGGGLFYLLPQFNFSQMKKALSSGSITQPEFDSIWNADGTVATHEDVVSRNTAVRKLNNVFAKQMVQNTLQAWRKQGLVTETSHMFDAGWVKKAERTLGIYNTKNKEGKWEAVVVERVNNVATQKIITRGEYINMLANFAALEYSANYFLFNTSMAQLVSGDPAMAYKPVKGGTDIENVISTLKEYQKRLAKDIGPGSDPTWSRNERYNTVTLADFDFKSYLGEFGLAAYNSFDTSTDAQELTTTREHLYVMYSEGKVPVQIYREMLNIIDEGLKSPSKYYEFTDPRHLAIVMQPHKPVYVGNSIHDGAMEIHYVKSSSYPLLPQFTKGLDLDSLRQRMEGEPGGKNYIARANFKSAKKLGSPVNPVNIFDSSGRLITEALNSSEFAGSIQQLTRDGFRIQQEVPYDEEKEAIRTVSQMNKLITEGILNMKGFNMWGQEYSGAEIRKIKEDIRSKMVTIGAANFLKKVGGEVDSEGNYTFTDGRKLFRALEEEAVSRKYPTNDIEALRLRFRNEDGNTELVLPLWFNGSSDRFESLMMSLVKKIVEVKMPGKSFIQASSAGYRMIKTAEQLTTAEKSGITYVQGYDPTKGLRSLDKDADGKTIPAQVLVPFNFFGKDGQLLNIQDFLTEDGLIDMEKLPAELLQFIGARIPNQGHNSMLPIQIVGFIPKSMGDLMIVPSEITQQMGSDFDVDKLYVYKRKYKYADGKLSVYQDDADREDKAQSLDSLKNEYFDVHWSVLTHPDMFNKILNPLDKPELKNEKALAEARANKAGFKNYFDVQSQLADYQSQKDAKRLVASSSLSATFNSLIQDKDLKLGMWDYENEEEKLSYVIFKDEVTGAPIKLNRLSGTGIATYYENESPSENDVPLLRTKHDNITSQQNEFLDHAKNRTIDFLNINNFTYPASAALSMLEAENGQAVSLKYNSRLLQQEIVLEYAAEMAQSGDSLSTEFTGNLKEATFDKLYSKYRNLANIKADEEIQQGNLSPQVMLEMLNTTDRSAAYFKQQLEALTVFQKLDAIGARLVEIQASLNQDTAGAGPNLLYSLNQEQRLNNLLVNDIILGVNGIAGGPMTEAGTFSDPTEIGTTFNNTTYIANRLYPNVLPYDKLQSLFKDITAYSGVKQLSVDRQREIFRELKSFMFTANQLELVQDASTERARLLYDTEVGPSLAKRVQQAKKTWGKDNYLLARLQTNIAEGPGVADVIQYNASKATSLDDYENIKAWITLLRGTDEQKKLGEDLVAYTYLTGGIQDAVSFVKYVPVRYLDAIPFAARLRDLNKSINLENAVKRATFLSQYYQHFPERAIKLSSDFAELGPVQVKAIAETGVVPEFFSLPTVTAEENIAKHLLISNPDKSDTAVSTIYPPYLSVKSPNNTWVLYRRNDVIASNMSTEYTRIDTLGQGLISEYAYDRGVQRSIFPENRALIAPPKALDPINVLTSFPEIITQEGAYPLFDEIGFRDGADFEAVASKLKNSPGVNFIHKVVLDIISPIIDHEIAIIPEAKPIRLRILPKNKRETDKHTILGQYSFDDTNSVRTLFLNPDALKTRAEIAETFVHEGIHAVTSLTVAMLDMTPESEHVALVGKKAAAAYQNIKTLWMYAKEKAPVNSKFGLEYGLTNVREFIAHSFEDREFQQYLNELQDPSNPGKTIFDKIASLVNDLMKAISEFIGVEVKHDSVLHSAIRESLHLMGYDSTLENPAAIEDDIVPTRYQLFPGVFANSEQREAIDKIINFINTKSTSEPESNYYVLSGAGGTGKTTIIKKIIQDLVDSGYSKSDITYSGLTHTAVQQLRRSVNDKDYDFSTIHSLLGIKKDERASIEQGKEVFKQDYGEMGPRISNFGVIVIDESSMLSDELMDYLRSSVSKHQKVIFMGDYAQLEPVGQTTDAYPFRDLLESERSSVLIKNERTSHSDIVDLLSNYRKTVDGYRAGVKKNVLDVTPFASRMNSRNVTFDKGAKPFFDAYIDKIKVAIADKNPYDTVLIAYRNATRETLNNAVRNRLYGANAPLFVSGDLLIVNDSYNLSKEDVRKVGQNALYNMQRAIVEKAEPARIEKTFTFTTGPRQTKTMRITAEGWNLTVNLGPEYNNVSVTAPYLPTEEIQRLIGMDYNSATKKATLRATGEVMKYGEYIAYRTSILSEFLNVEYAYAVTSHKSQGMTYPNVFVHEQDIISVGPASDLNKIKSLYTAYSRTKDHLWIYNANNPEQVDMEVLENTHGTPLDKIYAAFFPGQAVPVQVTNAADFDRNKALIEGKFPMIKVEMEQGTGDNTGRVFYNISMNISDAKVKDSAISDEMSKAINNLEALKKALYKKLVIPTGRKMSPEERGNYEVLKQEIVKLENEITALKVSRDLTFTEDIAERQLRWVDSIIAKPDLSWNEILTALHVAQTWNSVFDELYGNNFQGELSERANSLKGKAALKYAKILGIAQTSAVTGDSRIESYDDFSPEKMGTNWITSQTRDISRVSSNLGQEVGKLLQESAALAREESRRLGKNLDKYNSKIHDLAKSKGMKVQELYDLFLQKNEAGDAWGLVQNFSQDYFDFRKKTRAKLNATLAAAESLPIPARRKKIAAAWSKYNREVRQNLVFVDTSIFFDRETGALKNDALTQAEVATLLEHVGEADTNAMIAKAQEKYLQYLNDKASYRTELVKQNIAEIDQLRTDLSTSSLSPVEREEIVKSVKERLQQEFNRDLSLYETQYSPNSFFEKMAGAAGTNQRFKSYHLIVDAPRRSVQNGKFYDKAFEAIQQDRDLKEIYDFIKVSMDEFLSYLPNHVTHELGANFLPIVQKDLTTRLTSVKGVANSMNSAIIDTISIDPGYADWTQQGESNIPIRYIKPVTKTVNGVEVPVERETNIMVLLEKFGRSAYHYKHMITVEAQVEVLHELVNAGINGTESGLFAKVNDRTKNLSDQIQTAKDVIMYQRPKKAEYNWGKIYSLNPIEQTRMANEVANLERELTELDDKYALGQIDTDEYNEAVATINKKLEGYNFQEIYGSKIGDAAIKLTELKALSYNPFSALANLSFGLVSILVHGNGRKDFTQGQALQAFSIMMSATKKSISFGSLDSVQAEKILSLMARLNLMGDLLDSDYNTYTRVKNGKTRWKQTLSPYQMLHQSDYFVKGLIAVAMSLNKRVTNPATGEEISLWEALDKDANWQLGENPEWGDKDVSKETEWLKFQAQAKVVTKTIMGNQDSDSPMRAKRSVIGRLVSQFRLSWMAEGLASRFEDYRPDSNLGRAVKGRYRTYADIGLMGSVLTLGRQALSTIISIDPYTRKRRDGSALTELDIENMRKNLTEVVFFMGVAAAVLMLKYLSDDEEDPKKKRMMTIAINMLIRNRQDIQFYASPTIFDGITKSTVPAWRVWVDFERAMAGTGRILYNQGLGADPQDKFGIEQWALRMTKAGIPHPYAAQIPKFITMSEKDLDTFTR